MNIQAALGALAETADNLSQISSDQSYLPYWEQLYTFFHKEKGKLSIKNQHDQSDQHLIEFTDALSLALFKEARIQDYKNMANYLLTVVESWKTVSSYQANSISKFYINDIDHKTRCQKLSKDTIDESISKKLWEVKQLKLTKYELQEYIKLQKLTDWNLKLEQYLKKQAYQWGILIYTQPELNENQNEKYLVRACFAPQGQNTQNTLNEVKRLFPQATLKIDTDII